MMNPVRRYAWPEACLVKPLNGRGASGPSLSCSALRLYDSYLLLLALVIDLRQRISRLFSTFDVVVELPKVGGKLGGLIIPADLEPEAEQDQRCLDCTQDPVILHFEMSKMERAPVAPMEKLRPLFDPVENDTFVIVRHNCDFLAKLLP